MDAVHPDDVQAVRTGVAGVLFAGRALEFEVRYRRHDGAWRWHLERGEPLRNSSGGAITGWVGTSVDVHEQRQHAERAAHLLRLEQRLREVPTAREAATAACEVLCAALQSDFAGIGELTDDGEHIAVRSQWHAGGSPTATGHQWPTGTALEYVSMLRAGEAVCADDGQSDVLPAAAAANEAWPGAPGACALLQVPLVRQGALRAVLFVGCGQPRRWDEGVLALARDTLERAHG
jgi:hypothetical protein